MRMKPAAEWCVVEAQEMSRILISAEHAEMKKLVLVEASDGHYTAGTKVPCEIPVGSVIIPRMNPEIWPVHQMWRDKDDDRDLRMLHLRDVMSFIPPASH
jgi:hypothetical protein